MPKFSLDSSATLVAALVTAGIMLGCFLVVWALRARAGPAAGVKPTGTDETAALTRALIAELDRKTEELAGLVSRAEAVERRLNERVESPRAAPVVEAKPLLGEDPSNAKIFDLADQGRSAREIAALLDRPSGQVELVLNLRRAAERG